MTGVDAMQDRVRDSEMLRNRQWATSLGESTKGEGVSGVSGVPVVIAPGLGWETECKFKILVGPDRIFPIPLLWINIIIPRLIV